MKLGIVITQPEEEAVFNALRLANCCLQRDSTRPLSGRGIEIDRIEDPRIDSKKKVLDAGGQFFACGASLEAARFRRVQDLPVADPRGPLRDRAGLQQVRDDLRRKDANDDGQDVQQLWRLNLRCPSETSGRV